MERIDGKERYIAIPLITSFYVLESCFSGIGSEDTRDIASN